MATTSPEQLDFRAQGYTIARAVFDADEVAALRDHFDGLRDVQPEEYSDGVYDPQANDPLLAWPRLIQVHRWDATAREWLLSPRVVEWAQSLLGCTPLAVQSMVYFKPPGSRGQAMHQDNYFFRARPGTCLAAWLALDDCDDENGCIRVVPGSQEWPLLCPSRADTSVSFARDAVPLPPGTREEPIPMHAGDVLFFNGTLVHGSRPNVSDRFRRALIGHFVEERATAIAHFHQPLLHPDGRELWLEDNEEGGPCGVWVDKDGDPAIDVRSHLPDASFLARH